AVGAEIAARISERGLLSLLAPIARVAAPDVVVPLLRLENDYMPRETDIVEAARRVVHYS
ncbi:MAG: alpha-ketoacid dehydrogenase subunit beta, partial [Pseudomonadota bacterium]